MRSFFETPDKKKRHALLAGDLTGVTINLYLSFILFMHLQGTLNPFLETIGRLAPFAKTMAIADLLIFFTTVFLLFGSVHIGVYHLAGLYRVGAVPDVKRTAVKLGIAVFFAILIVFVFLTGLSRNTVPVSVWIFHAATLFAILLCWRFFYVDRRVSEEPYRILIIGGDAQSGKAAEILGANGSGRFFRFTVMPEDQFFEDLKLKRQLDTNMIVYPFAGNFSKDDLVSLVRKKFEGVSICDSLTFYKNCTGSFPVQAIDARWLINHSVSLSLMDRFQQRVKRIMDILTSGIGLFLTLPAIGLIAILIKITSKGAVFFVDERLGKHQKPFRLFKFRTMVADAEKETGPVWARKNDPRVTPVGRILRKSRLDELPQLLNILKGDMSIVGPRPIRKYFADQLTKKYPYYYLRFYVKPGLTGWAQVKGDYGDSMEGQLRKLEFELFYIHEYSLLLDFKILLLTIRKMFAGEGQ